MENIMGKGENADNQQFLLLPRCFPSNFSSSYSAFKRLILQHAKTRLKQQVSKFPVWCIETIAIVVVPISCNKHWNKRTNSQKIRMRTDILTRSDTKCLYNALPHNPDF